MGLLVQDAARADAVHPNLLVLKQLGHVGGQVDHAGLDGRIFHWHGHGGVGIDLKLRRCDAVHGCDVDDVAATLLLKVFGKLLAGQK